MKLLNKITATIVLLTAALGAEENPLASAAENIITENASVMQELASIEPLGDQTHSSTLAKLDVEEVVSSASYYSSYCNCLPIMNWPMFAKNFGAESFMVRLPNPPTVGDNGSIVTYNAFDYSVYPNPLYGVNFHINPIIHSDPIYVFQKVLQKRQESPYNQLISYSIGTVDGYYVMDMHLYDLATRVIQKERVIVTDLDVYFLYTLYFSGVPEFHQYFIDSFVL